LPLFAAGLLDMPRRVSTYAPNLQGLNVWVSISAFFLFSSMLVFAVNVIYSWFFNQEQAAANPWHALALEWQLPTPVPANNFEQVPTIVSGPYEYGVPGGGPPAELRPAAVAL
jgi:cytochrome c oxidase subunit 1